jgi:hypothetical protein
MAVTPNIAAICAGVTLTSSIIQNRMATDGNWKQKPNKR